MSVALSGLQVLGAEIISASGQRVDFSNGIRDINYFEDILSPCCTMSITVDLGSRIVNSLPIRGGEKVVIKLDTASGNFDRDGDKAFYVKKIENYAADGMKETFTLQLVSREGLTNETTRCETKYQKLTIDQHVTSILKDVLKTNNYESKNIEKTSNTYSFIGNQKKPFYILTWLLPKGIPVAGKSGTNGAKATGVAGYFFYENSEGFNYKSVEKLVGGIDKTNQPVAEYTYSNSIEHNTIAVEYKILDYKLAKNIDLISSLRTGMYSNITFFFDLYENRTDFYQYNLKEEIIEKLGEQDDIDVPGGFDNSPSRILVRSSDRGILDPNDIAADSGRDIADMAKSFSRYNLLFTQSLNMVVPCNIRLKVGDVIAATFPKVSFSDKSEKDSQQSGKYLIKGLRHHFEANANVTYLSLIRDSYGLTDS